MIYAEADPETMIEIPGVQPGTTAATMPLKALKERIVRISPGQRLAYVADAAGTEANLDAIVDFAQGVDHLFVEAAFSDCHREIALQKRHLTARQAGELARSCGVKQYTLFHHSPRYSKKPELLEKEAQDAFCGAHPSGGGVHVPVPGGSGGSNDA